LKKLNSPIALVLAAGLSLAVVADTEPHFSADRFKAHVAFLADDLLEGREAGTRGHEIAARYIASQFAVLGVKPAGTDGYFENVDLVESALDTPAPSFALRTPHGDRTFTQGEDVLVQGPIGGGEVSIDAPIVFVGYGIDDRAVGFDDYSGVDVRGKVVAVLRGIPAGFDSEVGAHLRSMQAHVAAEHGALATIAVQTRVGLKAFPWEAVKRFAGEPSTTWVGHDGVPFDPSGGLRASVMMEPSATESLFDGAPATLASILDDADRSGGRPKGMALKTTARITVKTKTRRYRSPEVVGVIDGSDPRLKHEYVALMAHSDHIGIAKHGTGDRINNGALDNAAGIATLLEVARAFTMDPQRPKRSILIVANTAEEKGLLGAEYFAHNPTVPASSIVAAIDLDMPLLLYDFTDVVAYGGTHSTMDKAIREAGASMHVDVSPDPMPEQAVFVRSDHYAMVKVGVPAVMLATGMANGGSAAWQKYLTTNYHQPSDDLSLPINWQAGAKFAELNFRAVRVIANAAARPAWYDHDYFGDLFAPKQPKAHK